MYVVTGLLFVGLFFVTSAHASFAATFTVNSTGNTEDVSPGNGICLDSNSECTFRAAVKESNALAGSDNIDFNISGAGPHTIVMTNLSITDELHIDGTAGSGGSTCATPSEPAHPNIVLDLNQTWNQVISFDAGSDGSSMKGISYVNALQSLVLFAPVTLTCNYIGMLPDGSLAPLTSNGGTLGVFGSNITIGGSDLADRNYINGPTTNIYGHNMANRSDLRIENNYIGTNIAGDSVISPDTTRAISIDGITNGVIKDNVMATNSGQLVAKFYNSSNLTITGNKFGTDPTGTNAVGNLAAGLYFDGTASNITVGGSSSGDRNIFSSNGAGIRMDQCSSSTDITVKNNYFGVDATGNSALGNLSGNETINSCTTNSSWLIADNIIAGSTYLEISLNGSGHHIVNNKIGVNSSQSLILSTPAVALNMFVSDSEIRGNTIAGFTQSGIRLYFNNNTIAGNFIGTDSTKTKDFGPTTSSAVGIYVGGVSEWYGADNNVIGGTSALDANYIYNFKADYSTPISLGYQGGNTTAILRNSIKNNISAPIYSRGTPKITAIQESGGNTTYTVEFTDQYNENFFPDGDYRAEFFSNTAPLNANGQLELGSFAGTATATKSGSNTATFTIAGTGYTNPTLTLTQLDGSSDGFGRTSSVGNFKPSADLELILDSQTTTGCVVGGQQNNNITFTIRNNGPNTVNNFNVNSLGDDDLVEGTLTTLTGGTVSSTDSFTEANSGSGEWAWSGSLESGQTVTFSTTFDISISPGAISSSKDLSVNSGNDTYYQEISTGNDYGNTQQLFLCGKDSDISIAITSRPLSQCATTGEQDRKYQVTVRNQGPNPVTGFNFRSMPDNDGMHENTTTTVVGGTATSGGISQQDAYYNEWIGVLEVDQTVIFEVSSDINTDSSAINANVGFEVYDSGQQGQYYQYYIETSDDNNYTPYFDEVFCDKAMDIKFEMLPMSTACLTAGEQNRTYAFVVTNRGIRTLNELQFGGDINTDIYTDLAASVIGGTATDIGQLNFQDGSWTGILEVGQTLEFSLTTNISSPSVAIEDGIELGLFSQDYANIGGEKDQIVQLFEPYCDRTADIASSISLDPPGLIQGHPAIYRLRAKNLGPATLNISANSLVPDTLNISESNGLDETAMMFLYAYFPPELSVTSIDSPNGYDCATTSTSQIEPELNVPTTGTLVVCQPDGTLIVYPGDEIEVVVHVLAGEVTEETTVDLIAFSLNDIDLGNFEEYFFEHGLFNSNINNVSRYIGLAAGSSDIQPSESSTGQVTNLPKNSLLAKTGLDQSKIAMFTIVMVVASFTKIYTYFRRNSKLE